MTASSFSNEQNSTPFAADCADLIEFLRARDGTKPGSGPEPDSETAQIPASHLVPAAVLRLGKLVGRSRSCAEDQSGRNEPNSRNIKKL